MVLAIAVLVPLIGLALLSATARAVLTARRDAHGDGARAVLLLACRHLPADRVDWSRAILTELEYVQGRAGRWWFALGGVRAAVVTRVVGGLSGRPSVTVVLAGIAGCAGLTLAALISYPALRADPKIPLLLVALAVVLLGYATLAITRTRDGSAGAAARRYGTLTGSILGAIWFVAATAWWHLHSGPFIVAMLLPLVLGALAARSPGGMRTAVTSVTWAGLVAGLAVFIGFAIDAYATAHGPYDTAQLDEYAHSGYTSAPAYWMGEGLAVSFLLLLLVPCLTVVTGTLGALVGTAQLTRPAK